MASAKNNTISTENRNSCTCCSEDRPKEFYKSFNSVHKYTQKMTICKKCMEIEYQRYISKYNDSKLALYYICRKFDIFFCLTAYEGALNQSASTGWDIIPSYIKLINSFRDKDDGSHRNGYGVCFDDSFEFLDRVVVVENKQEDKEEFKEIKPQKQDIKKITYSEEDEQNKKDVTRLLKYDPFFDEPDDIKPFLYNKLVDFLDANTLKDGFKLPIVIEVVKGFGQAEKINRALSKIDIIANPSEIGNVKTLSDTKQNILRSILSMAKDNGISENYSNNKSKGAGTLTGLIKELQEKGVHAAEVNLYDVQTCQGMKQVADISNKSILEQLMLNENDYVDMIKEQRELVQELDEKASKFEEENRILKVKIKNIEEYLKEKNENQEVR